MRPFLADQFSPSCSVQAIEKQLARLNVHPAAPGEVAAARELGARLIGPAIVSQDALRAVQDRSGCALFVTRDGETVTGVLATIPLGEAGLAAVEADRFSGLSPDPAHVARIGEEPVAIYVWGMAAERKMAGARLCSGLLAMGDRATPHLPYFGRAASATGLHLLQRTGFTPMAASQTGLLRREPALSRKVAA